MSNTKRVQLRKGTELEHSSFTGALAEVTFDTDKGTIRVHDGLTLSGTEIQKSRLTTLNSSNNGEILNIFLIHQAVLFRYTYPLSDLLEILFI
jgi:hypothetical protein